MKGYQKPELCKKCGGECCKLFPGAYFPGDYGFEEITVEKLVAAFRTEKVAVDFAGYSPDDMYYYLRPKRKSVADRDLVDYLLVGSGACTYLTDSGCELPFEQRPLNCRMLEPRPRELGCTAHGFMKESAAREWLPYQKIIAKAIDTYYNED